MKAEFNKLESEANFILLFILFAIILFVFLPVGISAQGFSRIELNKIVYVNSPVNNPAYRFNGNNYFNRNALSDLNSTGSANSAAPDLTLFGNFGNNFLDSFKGNNLYLHLAAVASTYLIVSQDIDYKVEKYFNEHEEFGEAGRPVVFSGMMLPFIASGSLYAYGKIKKDDEVLGASYAVMQSSIIALLYNSFLKAITGRPHPDWRNSNDIEGLSKTFRFGFMRGGMFWGWPSGHTSSTMAVVSALTNYYPDKTWLKIAGYSLAAYTIFGVSSVNRGGMHWFSDAVAAAFIYYAIGSTVGKYYRKVYSSPNPAGTNSSKINAASDPNPIGINFSFQF